MNKFSFENKRKWYDFYRHVRAYHWMSFPTENAQLCLTWWSNISDTTFTFKMSQSLKSRKLYILKKTAFRVSFLRVLIFPLRRDNNVVKSASVLFWRLVTMETNTTAYVKLDYVKFESDHKLSFIQF